MLVVDKWACGLYAGRFQPAGVRRIWVISERRHGALGAEFTHVADAQSDSNRCRRRAHSYQAAHSSSMATYTFEKFTPRIPPHPEDGREWQFRLVLDDGRTIYADEIVELARVLVGLGCHGYLGQWALLK